MKKLLLSLATVVLSSTAHAGIQCTTDGIYFDYLTIERDGGEETVQIHHLSERKETLLVIENDGRHITAVVDNDLTGGKDPRGVMISLNSNTGKGQIAYRGFVLDIECR